MDKGVVNKIKISLFMMVFLVALMFSNNKPNINYVDAQHISNAILGVKDSKSTWIVKEREKGLFVNKEDFHNRVVKNKEYRVGDIVFDRIVKTYKIGE
ncbi:MAG: hypothetical protein ACRDBY_04690 [Cetobacterium sp.]